MTDDTPTDLYRLRDSEGGLLYVGVSHSTIMRASQHRLEKTWWLSVASIDVEHFATRTEALKAETDAILNEGPAHNVQGVRVVSDDMVRRLAEAGTQVRELTILRDNAIRDAHDDDMSLRAIAEAVGMSHMGVQRIVQRDG